MPRNKRNLVEAGIYHIMIRGVNKQIVFNDDKDREMFIRLMHYYRKKLNCKIYAYCLMDNHVHILFKDKEYLISDFMRNVTSIYAREFNKKYQRVGHLFQDRFKSIYVYNDDYLLRLIRYIHRNPEKAGICSTQNYMWSSYKEYVYTPQIIEKDEILFKFDTHKSSAIKKFKEFISNSNEDNLDRIYVTDKLTDGQAKILIEYLTKVKDISLIRKYNNEMKQKIIDKILEESNLSQSQIARVLGISKNFKRRM